MTVAEITALANLVITAATALVIMGRNFGRTERATEHHEPSGLAAISQNGMPTVGELSRRVRQLEDARGEDRVTYVHRVAYEAQMNAHEREHDELTAAVTSLRAADAALATRIDALLTPKER